jgi:hypothetical protein
MRALLQAEIRERNRKRFRKGGSAPLIQSVRRTKGQRIETSSADVARLPDSAHLVYSHFYVRGFLSKTSSEARF